MERLNHYENSETEKRSEGTTWEDVAKLKDQMNSSKSLEKAVSKDSGFMQPEDKGQAVADAREKVLEALNRSGQGSGKVSLEKPKMKIRRGDKIVETSVDLTHLNFSRFNRYPEQKENVMQMMHETYEKGKPLEVLNIGVSQGQEALGYVQAAADLAGEDKIQEALDLELVEYAEEIPIVKKLPEDISESSRNYLASLYETPKAHFGTPFQEYVRELKENGDKKDVVLFNNVIQHLDYSVGQGKMMEDMDNLADVVSDDGILCMTCEKQPLSNPEVNSLFNNSVNMLEKRGFKEVSEGIFRKEREG